MTVGKTHSGKTTFGKKLAKKLKHFCLLDSDEIAIFLKHRYPNLYNGDFVGDSTKLSAGYYLKLSLVLEVYKTALKTDLPIISTSANSKKGIRGRIIKMAEESGRKVILVYFNLPDEVLLKRIEKGRESSRSLAPSKEFKDFLINKQSQQFEVPRKKEAGYYFEITDNASYKRVFEEVSRLFKNKK